MNGASPAARPLPSPGPPWPSLPSGETTALAEINSEVALVREDRLPAVCGILRDCQRTASWPVEPSLCVMHRRF